MSRRHILSTSRVSKYIELRLEERPVIVITLSNERMLTPEERDLDAMRRDRIGYSPTMSELALFDANSGMWVISDKRACTERYALLVWSGDWYGKQAVEIETIEKVWHPNKQAMRSQIHGNILHCGHPIHDAYVGQPCPLPKGRNPVRYFEAPEETRLNSALCRCNCGELAPLGRDFKPGHDQTALHDRVKKIGTVAEFIDWFDALEHPFQRG